MFSEDKYVNIRMAIGELVMNGLRVYVKPNIKGVDIVDELTGENIVSSIRDGSTYKVRTSKVQDWIDQNEFPADS